MSEADRVLQRIVVLKRQKAEQQFQTLQRDLRNLETTIRALLNALESIDRQDVAAEFRILAHQQGHAQKLIAEISAVRGLISNRKTQLCLARDALRRTIHSDRQLQREFEASAV